MTDSERFALIERSLNEHKALLDQILVRLAVRDEREKGVNEKFEKMQSDMDKNLGRLEARVDEVTRNMNKFAWIVIVAVIGGLMKFILEGGLSNGGL